MPRGAAYLPDPARTAAIWRERAIRAGIGDLYLARVESFVRNVDPKTIGFDAAIEFAPDWHVLPAARFHRQRWNFPAKILHRLSRLGLIPNAYLSDRIYPYDPLARAMLEKLAVHYRRFRCATPRWDNSSGTPALTSTNAGFAPPSWVREKRSRIVNAWNEWAEGNRTPAPCSAPLRSAAM